MKLNYTGFYASLLISCAVNATPIFTDTSPDDREVTKKPLTMGIEEKENIAQPSKLQPSTTSLQSSSTSKSKKSQNPSKDLANEGKDSKCSLNSSVVRKPVYNDTEAQETAKLEAQLAHMVQFIKDHPSAADQSPLYLDALQEQVSARKALNKYEQELARIGRHVQDNALALDQASMYISWLHRESEKIKAQEAKLKVRVHGKTSSHFGSLQDTPNWQAQKIPSQRGRSLSRSANNMRNSLVPKLSLPLPGQDSNVAAPSMGLRTKSSPTLPVAVPGVQTAEEGNNLRNSSEGRRPSLSSIPPFRPRSSPRHSSVNVILGTAETAATTATTDLPPSSPRGKSPRSPRMAP